MFSPQAIWSGKIAVIRSSASMCARGAGSLQFKIELGAEALAQRQPPGAVEPAAIGRVDDQLHAADFVEEALEDDRVEGREHAKRGAGGGEVFEDLARRAVIDADF